MKTCIITGAGSGIGEKTAIKFSIDNPDVHIALLGRNSESLEATKQLMKNQENVSLWNVDLSCLDKIPEIINSIFAKTGSIDYLFNIAGYTDPQPLLSTTIESMQQTYAVNVFAPFVLIRECVRYMKKRGGKILNVASTAGMTPRPGWLSYSSSKAAVISMSQTLTEELAEYGIQVYCVSPGRCATNLRKKLAPNEDPTTIMQPEEVAKILCDLMDDDEKCLDGQNIIVRKQLRK